MALILPGAGGKEEEEGAFQWLNGNIPGVASSHTSTFWLFSKGMDHTQSCWKGGLLCAKTTASTRRLRTLALSRECDPQLPGGRQLLTRASMSQVPQGTGAPWNVLLASTQNWCFYGTGQRDRTLDPFYVLKLRSKEVILDNVVSQSYGRKNLRDDFVPFLLNREFKEKVYLKDACFLKPTA